ncbi:MAG: diguanylate cyclase [Alphaproteobacteria bacterium]|nr:diguanylate cyclase [Alphaproteobacteria bacterium]
MIEGSHCFAIVDVFFLITTLLFILLTFVFMNRSKHLRKKLSNMIEEKAKLTKDLENVKQNTKNPLDPFIPETSKSIIISIDLNEKITSANDYATEVFGFSKEELIGNNIFNTIFPKPERKDSLQANLIARIFNNPKMYVENETQNIKKNGEKFWVSWTNRVVYDDKGEPLEIRAVGFDITKRKKLEEELRYLASVDPLTGALNRQALLEVGATEVSRAARYNRQISILIMKLNYFYEPSQGSAYTFSDEILQETVSICRKAMRDCDYLGRIGDVEFALILPETPAENAVFLAERLKQKIQEKNLQSETGAFITATFGVSGRDTKDDTIDSLILRALQALQKTEQKETQKTKKTKKKGA